MDKTSFMGKFIFCFLVWGGVVVCASLPLPAQIPTQSPQILRGNGPFSGRAKSLVAHNQQLFAIVTDAETYTVSGQSGSNVIAQSGIYRSADNGATWSVVSSFPVPTLASALFSHNGTLFVLTSSVGLLLYQSRDDGASWSVIPSGIISAVTHLVSFGDTLFARTGLETRISAMVMSVDSGRSWSLVSSPGSIGSVVASRSRSAAAQGRSLLFGGSPNGLLRSADRGISWPIVPTTPAISNVVVFDVATKANDELFLATSQGVFTSNNDGQTWRSFNTGLEAKTARSFALQGEILFAATNDGLYANSGTSWQKVSLSGVNSGAESYDIAVVNNEKILSLYLGAQNGVFLADISTSGSVSAWEQINRGLPSTRIEQGGLALSGKTFLAASPILSAFRAIDGTTWTPASTGLPVSTATLRVAASQTSAVAVITNARAVFASSDAAATWRTASIGIGNDEISSLGNTSGGTQSAERFLLGTQGGSIFRANDNAALVWSKILSNPLEGLGVGINGFLQSTNSIYCATNEGLLTSNDAASSWSRVAPAIFPHIPVRSLAASHRFLLAGTNEGVYRSLDGGRFWQAPQPSANIGTVLSLVIKNGLLYAGTEKNGVFRSTDNGVSWQKLDFANGSLAVSTATSMVVDSTKLMIGTPNGIYEYRLPSPFEFPIITSFQPSDSAIAGLTDIVLAVNGANFSTTASVVFAGQVLAQQFASATQILVRVPVALLQTIGTVRVEVVNSPMARTSASFRVVALPQDFPRLTVSGNTRLEAFSTFVTQTSTVQRYTLSGTNVRDSVLLQAPQGFDLSADSGRTWNAARLAFTASGGFFTRDIFVRFRPLTSQTVSGVISHSVGGIVLQSLVIVGSPRSLQLEISPNGTLTFGSTQVGRTLKQSVSLVNTNPVSITIATIFTGVNAADFSASVQQIVIPPSGRATVDVIFSPQGRGEREAIINFSGLASGQISLRGRGLQAVFTFSTAEIQFSTAAFVGQSLRLPAENVRITNEGDVSDVVTGFRITDESSLGVAFRVRNFPPVRLEPGNSVPVTVEFTPEAEGLSRNSMRIQTEDTYTSSATVLLRGRAQALLPPSLTAPRNGGAVQGSAALLQWQAALLATHYEVAMEASSNSPRLLSRVIATTALTNTSVEILSSQAYYWTVRSLAVSGSDTLARSTWQNLQFFSSGMESRISVPPLLDFGFVTQEQVESPPRGQPLTVASGVWRILDVGIVQENNLADADFRAFRVLNRETLLNSGAVIRPSAESYTISLAFRPPQPRQRPYSALAELRVQNEATGEIRVLPFQLRAQSSQCPQIGAASIGNQGCPETILLLQILPQKTVFAPGDDIRLQIHLVGASNLPPNLERFMRQLRLTLDVQNITLLSFSNRLSAGTAVAGDTSVRVVSFASAVGSASPSSSLLSNTDGKIRLDLLRPSNALQNVVLGELTGKAVIGLRGLGATAEESVTSARISIANVQWLSDTREALDSGQVIVWGGERGVPISLQRVEVTVNTCQTTQGSLLLTATLPVNIKSLAPNPVQDETTITFTLQERGWTEMELINGFGQAIKKIFAAEMLPGEYTVRCSVSDLPSGSYFLLLRTPFETVQQRMGVIR